MQTQSDINKGPGVKIQPPFYYLAFFLAAYFLHYLWPVDSSIFHTSALILTGVVFLVEAAIFGLSGLMRFIRTKNTVILTRRASSLQTEGIYRYSRNPMYVGMAFLYLALSIFAGNWWHIVLFPFLLISVQESVIKREEKYLRAEFGGEYLAYLQKVRRWL